MKIEIPYDELELRIALLGLDQNKFTEEKLEELKGELIGLPNDKKTFNKETADYHGISVDTLVNSPNYMILCEEYADSVIKKVVKKLLEKFDITEKQAWAIMALWL